MTTTWLSTVESTTRLNEGWAWSHPLESSYARARRRLIANPAVGLKAIKLDPRNLPSTASESDLEHLLPFALGCTAPRQCPDCARHLFHPALYQLPSVYRCPVHDRAFSHICPSCGLSWLRSLKVVKPLCSHCGKPPWEQLGKVQLRRAAYRKLLWLNRWVTTCLRKRGVGSVPTLHDLRAIMGWVGDSEGSRFQAPHPAHRFFLAFACAEEGRRHRKRLAALNVVTVDQPLHCRRTQLTPWMAPENQLGAPRRVATLGLQPLSSGSKGRIALALRRLIRWQRTVLDSPHTLIWRDSRRLRPEQYPSEGQYCPLCLAFGLWCQAITLKYANPASAATPGCSELCRVTAYEAFPLTPEGVYLQGDTEQIYRPSAAFERWLFLRSTDLLFVELVHLVLWFREQLMQRQVRFTTTTYPANLKFVVPALGSQLLACSVRETELTASYLYSSPLQEFTLDADTKALAQQCARLPRVNAPTVWSLPPSDRRGIAELETLVSRAAPAFHRVAMTDVWHPHLWATAGCLSDLAINPRVLEGTATHSRIRRA